MPSHDCNPPPTASASVPPPPTDHWQLTTGNAPAKTLLYAAATLALLAALATLIDLPLARWVKGTDLPRDLERFIRLCEAFGFGGTVAVIILAAGLLDPRGWFVIRRLVVSVFGAGLAANAAKLLIARERPSFANLDQTTSLSTFVGWLPLLHREDLPTKYGHALQSFPSGHSATATSLALTLALLYPRGRYLFIALAALACYQRIDASAHYLSDCLTGAAIACAVTALSHHLSARTS
jgi:membrane-associated phospholipid phosphatase